jgi:beta-galactosidase
MQVPLHRLSRATVFLSKTLTLANQALSGPQFRYQVIGNYKAMGEYTNVIYPFSVFPPYVPTENETGTYRRSFHVPSDWDNSTQLRLRFDGVDSAFHVWVNGLPVGYSQGSRNPAEFDITASVNRCGSNDLFVRVYQWCDGSYIEDQDQWWLSGA